LDERFMQMCVSNVSGFIDGIAARLSAQASPCRPGN